MFQMIYYTFFYFNLQYLITTKLYFHMSILILFYKKQNYNLMVKYGFVIKKKLRFSFSIVSLCFHQLRSWSLWVACQLKPGSISLLMMTVYISIDLHYIKVTIWTPTVFQGPQLLSINRFEINKVTKVKWINI